MPFKIYYLDDEPFLLEMFVDTFAAPGREITTFSDPDIAIETIKKSPPDILFIDYRLPKYNGDSIAMMLDPQFPKFLITGDIEVKCVYKFDAIFDKPYKANQIEKVIEKIVSQKNQK